MFEASHPTQAQVSQGAGTESPPGHSSEETEQRGYPDHESNTRALVGGATPVARGSTANPHILFLTPSKRSHEETVLLGINTWEDVGDNETDEEEIEFVPRARRTS
jgi:hypothetical protein